MPEERQTARIAHEYRKPGMDECLPVVGVNQNVANRPRTGFIRNAPVQADAVATLLRMVRERDTGSTEILAMRWCQNRRMHRLTAELIDHV